MGYDESDIAFKAGFGDPVLQFNGFVSGARRSDPPPPSPWSGRAAELLLKGTAQLLCLFA